jgi:murein DD-endopeptidase MepM/ murein hydrolase activator NlpD
MIKHCVVLVLVVLFFSRIGLAQMKNYPQNYFRHPLNIPMQLVANFGEIRTNHWHMGLDIRTQQKVNLPVYAAADGFVARVSVEPGGFGQAIYIQHPNGYTTVYGHLNAFFPALADYIKEQQYQKETWSINLVLQPGQFPVKKGMFIARSGSTGASEGPHVHFEIRDSETENCLNPLLFRFPIADAVPPSISRLVMYDRNKSTYVQNPQVLSLRRSGSTYTVQPIRSGSRDISFAVGAVDRFSSTPNPNGIYSASVFVDDEENSGFVLDNISYNDTRYINAQLDYPYKARGISLQHLSPLPGAREVAYHYADDGIIHLNDTAYHNVRIEIKDANGNKSVINLRAKFDPLLAKSYEPAFEERLLPNNVNVFETESFEVFTTEKSIYDTAVIHFNANESGEAHSISPVFTFMNANIPAHDAMTFRIKPSIYINEVSRNHIVIKNQSGNRVFIQKAVWQKDWVSSTFRQFGTFQAFVDDEPPLINNPPSRVSVNSRIAFTPTDNFHSIRSFRAEIDGQWLRFSNDKGRSWIYYVDEKFPSGEHELKVTVEDEAGNVTERTWKVKKI